MSLPTVSELEAIGRAHGLHRVGVTTAEPFLATRADLFERRERGLSADMQFTYRNPDRSTDPARTLDGVRTLVVAARAYPAPVGAGASAGVDLPTATPAPDPAAPRVGPALGPGWRPTSSATTTPRCATASTPSRRA